MMQLKRQNHCLQIVPRAIISNVYTYGGNRMLGWVGRWLAKEQNHLMMKDYFLLICSQDSSIPHTSIRIIALGFPDSLVVRIQVSLLWPIPGQGTEILQVLEHRQENDINCLIACWWLDDCSSGTLRKIQVENTSFTPYKHNHRELWWPNT